MRHYLTLATSKCCCDAVMLWCCVVHSYGIGWLLNPILVDAIPEKVDISYIRWLLLLQNLVYCSFCITFAASSSNTVFLWIHVLDLCVLLKIALFVRMDVSVFFHNFTKGLWFIRSACECGAFLFCVFLGFLQYFIYLCRHRPHQTKKNTWKG